MAWDFETEPEFQAELDWIEDFVKREIEPLDFVITSPVDTLPPVSSRLALPFWSSSTIFFFISFIEVPYCLNWSLSSGLSAFRVSLIFDICRRF